MDREDFLDALKEQYADRVRAIYLECEHDDGKRIDYPRLNEGLAKLLKGAEVEGLPEQDFVEIVRATLPDHAERLTICTLEPEAA